MPLFQISGAGLKKVGQGKFSSEKELHRLIEQNLEVVFNCRVVATEFSTGAQHAGRIDTLALSEDGNPVIIEYKVVESSDLINQSLFYLSWIDDHRGDFEMAVHKRFGSRFPVDWSAVRVICIAPNYRKYDLHAVKMMGANIELWTYRRFENNTMFIEEVLKRTVDTPEVPQGKPKNPVMVAAGKKAAATKSLGLQYSADDIFDKAGTKLRDVALTAHDYIRGLDQAIEVVPKKVYIAYKTTENIVCMDVNRSRVALFLKLNPKKVPGPAGMSRDVSQIGHYGTGDLEIVVKSLDDLEKAKPYIQQAYQAVGG
ncbi:MAG: transporter [Acidimicrobiia bacterium]